ncbi:MFS transporter [Planctomonas sp. JC2975]|uniref:MFS transporter n=1 Tax=Planctomonas sp. JC2975 TaxID=2729626 RepID=UPI001472B485|nr:MFS transporter [Planctomonas sp. JC2975]NNC12738.1 MFS transporter [Planctomonas sp. JC2975]
MTTTTRSDAAPHLRIARRLAPAQALYVFGSSVDLTLTGIVGSRLAPTTALATVPFSLIPVVAVATTFVISRFIGRLGYRRVFVSVAFVAVLAGLVSAVAVQLDLFWLFCVGTGLIGAYSAGAGYYRYAAADASGSQRARAVTTVLAGGLVAALLGPFLATWVSGLLPVAFVASYLLVALFGALAAVWNLTLPRELAELGRGAAGGGRSGEAASAPEDRPRTRRVLWRQPVLIAGVAATSFAAISMTSMMTAGPIAGMAMGHSEADAALAVQLHMIGMFAPGFVIARVIGRFGERSITVAGAILVIVAGAAAACSTAEWAFLTAMFAIGVGWNFAFSGGSALITDAYRPSERGRVQPIAEVITNGFQVVGSLSAGVLATVPGWRMLGIALIVLSVVVGIGVAAVRRSVRSSAPDAATASPAADA